MPARGRPSGSCLRSLAGAFTAVTAALLVADLKQPRRFLFLLTRPNWSSWLVRGALVLGVYALVAAAWFVSGLAGSERALQVLALPGALAAAAAAGYTAALFAQCEGRDLWQTPLLLPDLLAQAVIAGAAAFGLADLVLAIPEPDAVRWALLGGLVAHLALVTAEVVHHRSSQVALAVRVMIGGREAPRFWAGVMGAVLAGRAGNRRDRRRVAGGAHGVGVDRGADRDRALRSGLRPCRPGGAAVVSDELRSLP